jgi:hypothetical protein
MPDPFDSLEVLSGLTPDGGRPHVPVGVNFEKRLRDLREHAGATAAALQAGDQSLWYRPEGWDGDVLDFDTMGTAFARDDVNNGFVQVVSGKPPGPAADAIAAAAMVDQLGVMERALRLRHMSPLRAVALATGRMAGHGHERGVFVQNHLEYVRSLLREGRR